MDLLTELDICLLNIKIFVYTLKVGRGLYFPIVFNLALAFWLLLALKVIFETD